MGLAARAVADSRSADEDVLMNAAAAALAKREDADDLALAAAAAATFFLLEPDDDDDVTFLTVAARDDAAPVALDLSDVATDEAEVAGERGPEVEDEVDESGTTSADKRRP